MVPSLDEIPSKFWKYDAKMLVFLSPNLVNLSVSKSDLKNCRTISLLRVVSKMMGENQTHLVARVFR